MQCWTRSVSNATGIRMLKLLYVTKSSKTPDKLHTSRVSSSNHSFVILPAGPRPSSIYLASFSLLMSALRTSFQRVTWVRKRRESQLKGRPERFIRQIWLVGMSIDTGAGN